MLFFSNQDGVTYINNCFKQTEGNCTSTLDYLRNFEVIRYPDGTALTFQQVAEMAATECDEIGGISNSLLLCIASQFIWYNYLKHDNVYVYQPIIGVSLIFL